MEPNDFANQSFAVDTNVLDLDMPNFNPTKYNKVEWRVFHSITYFIFSTSILFSYVISLIIAIDDNKKTTEFFIFKLEDLKSLLLVTTGIFYFISSVIEWLHFKRGCLGLSNLNSKMKTNRDMSISARLRRAKTGFMYFLCVISSVIILYAGVIEFSGKNEKLKEINLYVLFGCFLILSFSGILKLDRITEKTKQYTYSRDLSYFLSEFSFFVGSLLFTLGYMYNYVIKDFINDDKYPSIKHSRFFYLSLFNAGGLFYFLSSIFMIYRYFCSGFQDLNLTLDSESEISF